MTEGATESTNGTTRRIRSFARISSLVILGFTMVMVIGHLVGPEPIEVDYPPIENLLLLVMCLSVLGLGIAWRWEGLGGGAASGSS